MSEINRYLRAETSQDLSAAGGTVLNYTTSFACNYQLMQICFKASTTITETINTYFVSRKAGTYTTLLDTTSLSSASNYVFRPSGNCIFMDGDEIQITCTAANHNGTVYATIIAEPYGRQQTTQTGTGL